MCLDWCPRCCVCVFLFLFFIFIFIFIDVRISCGSVCQWVPCIVHGTHHLFDNPNFHWNDTALCTEPITYLCTVHGTHKPLYSVIFSLKKDLTALFTHLKIILLVFLVFSKISSIQTDT